MPAPLLPDFITARKAAYTMQLDPMTGSPYRDNASVFRCWALHSKARPELELARTYKARSAILTKHSRSVQLRAILKVDEWCTQASQSSKTFKGVPLEKFADLERFLGTTIRVYRYEPPALPKRPADLRTEGEGVATELAEQLVMEREADEAGEAARCLIVYAGCHEELPGGVMNVNVYTDSRGADHFSYIGDLRRFMAMHDCAKCHYIFSTRQNLRRHQRGVPNCDETQHLFPGNGATLTPTLFERLDEMGVRVEEARRYSRYFAVFDFESCARTLSASATFNEWPPRNVPMDLNKDSRVPPATKACYGTHWPRMRTQVDPNHRFFVLRGERMHTARTYTYALAQKQKACFDLRAKLLTVDENGKLVDRELGVFPWIRNEIDLKEALEALLSGPDLPASLLWSIRVEAEPSATSHRVLTPLAAVSVAIATNIDGIEPAFLCRREDDEPVAELVSAFVDRLHVIQAVAAELMRSAFADETKRLAELADGFTRVICAIFGRAVADAQNELAEMTKEPEKGQLSTTVAPAAIAMQQARVHILASFNAADEDFAGFRLPKKLKAAMHPDAATDFFVYRSELRKVVQLQRDLETFCTVLPVLGFNSGAFDLKLIRPWLLPYLQSLQPRVPVGVLKKATKYLQITTSRIRFLDVSNYLARFTPYGKWVTAYTQGAETKGAWCYDYFERPSQLCETSLPPREAFDSALKGSRCSEAEYEDIQRIWQENGMRTLYDYLRYYNLRDVEPFVKALEAMRIFWQANGQDMFNNVCTLPGLADRFVRNRYIPPYTSLVLPQKVVDRDTRRVIVDNSDVYEDMKRAIVGGPACVYHRLHIAGETRLRGNGQLCQHIVGWDCNGLYLKCSSEAMPTGIPVRYTPQKSGFFKRRPLYAKAQSQLKWLEWTAFCCGTRIQHQFNSSKPPYVAGQRPDGFAVMPNGARVAYFFDGCRYHGHGGCIANPRSRFPDGMNARKKRKQDFAIMKALEARRIRVVRMRECTWMKMKRVNARASAHGRPPNGSSDPTLREFLAEHVSLPRHGKMTEAGLLGKVRRGRFFGTLVCDVEVPEGPLREHFAEFEPIFKNVTVTEQHLSPHMRTYLRRMRGPRQRKLMRPKRMLVNSFFAKNCVLHTPLARWYLDHDLVIRNVRKAYEYKPKVLYGEFARQVAAERRLADADASAAIKGDLFKLAGNSIYGKSVTAVERHTRTRVCNRKQVSMLERNPRVLKSVDWLGDDQPQWAEACLKQSKVEHKLYTPFGSFVYQYAKLRMLQFYYDYIDYYWERKHFQLMYMDTDSFYFALAQPSLAEFMRAVRPERRQQFNANYPEQFLARDDPNVYTAEQIRWDRREVGLYKVETNAKKMLALNPKSLICVDVTPSGFECVQKLSAKGVLRKQNPLTWRTFLNVLQTKQDHVGVARVLQRPRGRQQVCSIAAPKRCLSYAFYKRWLADDGVTTKPLGL